MNNNFPLISIIIPTYQRPDNLLRAISSAQKQTYPNIEIIVVDDNGIDSKWHYETEKILSSFTRLVALFLDSRIHYSLHLYIFHLLFMNFMCRE